MRSFTRLALAAVVALGTAGGLQAEGAHLLTDLNFVRGGEPWVAGPGADSGSPVRPLIYETAYLTSIVADGSLTYLVVSQALVGGVYRVFSSGIESPPKEIFTTVSRECGRYIFTGPPRVWPLDHGAIILEEETCSEFALHGWDRATGALTRLFDTGNISQTARLIPLLGIERSGVHFVASFASPERSDELWFTDGTAAGTRWVASWPARSQYIRPIGAQLALLTAPSPQGEQLLAYDLAAHQLRVLATMPTGSQLRDPVLTDTLGRVYLPFYLSYRPSLWRTDGTPEGTLLLTALAADERFIDATTIGPDFVLSVYSRDIRAEIRVWRSGSSAPEVLWGADIGYLPELGKSLTPLGSNLLFVGWDESEGLELWSADTNLWSVTRLTRTSAPNGPRFLGASQRLLYFELRMSTQERELWATDGLPAGTVPLLDDWRCPPPDLFVRSDPIVHRERLYFSHDDGVHGFELWTSNGTPEGTRLVADIAPGAAESRPYALVVAGKNLYFTADDRVHGRAIWVLPLDNGVSRRRR